MRIAGNASYFGVLQPIEALKGTENFLKVPLRGTFKKFSGFYKSAKRCIFK
jgi:hypothetical protein